METTAETVIADLRDKNIKGAVEHLNQLEAQDGSFGSDAYKRNIAAINSRVDLKQLGLKDAGQLLGTDSLGNLMVTSADNSRLQHVMPDGKLYGTMPNLVYSFRQMSAELQKQSSEDQLGQLGPGNII